MQQLCLNFTISRQKMFCNLFPPRKLFKKVMAREEEEEEEVTKARSQNKRKIVIEIPSYKEVIESSRPKPASQLQQQSFFKPSQSFSQAFSFIKNSEFYAPPPPPPSSSNSGSSPDNNATPRKIGETSTVSVASSSSQATQNRNAILVSHRQKGNPLLRHIRNVKWAFADVVCDYLLGQNACALYISVRYHLLHPDYLYFRIRELQKGYKLRVVLCHVDVEDVVKPLLEITKTALLHDCTLLCGWSLEECGRYLETIKMYENKPADLIQGQMDTDYLSRLNHALTTVRHVNKTDVVTLGSTFGSLSNIMDASMEDLARCPGIGERKVKRLHDTFHEPFKRVISSHPFVPETTVQKGSDDPSVNEIVELGKEKEDTSKCGDEEPEITVKSALSIAFAKYADKFGKKNSKSPKEKMGETSVAVELETSAASGSPGEGTTD